MSNHVMYTFGRDFRNYISGHTSTSRLNYFVSHRKAGAQGIRSSRMSAELIVTTQIGKGYFAIWYHANEYYLKTLQRLRQTEWH